MFFLLSLFFYTVGAVIVSPPKTPTQICPGSKELIHPPYCGPHAHYEKCPDRCPKFCSSLLRQNETCLPTLCCAPSCQCDSGYLRNDNTWACVKKEDCPQYNNIKCKVNEHPVVNMTICPKTCGNRLLTYPIDPCDPFTGCACNEGYVRPFDNATGTCIPVGKCPPIPKKCGFNELPTSCAFVCPPQVCEIAYTEYLCLPHECQPGCNCRQDYLRDCNNICIINTDCPLPGEKCVPICRPTCAVPNPQGCRPPSPKDPNACPDGFVLTEEGGNCTYIESCPENQGCNGDPNAIIRRCPSPCPSTCDAPNSNLANCKKECQLGCECKDGYIRREENGPCILPDDCPCGNPCNRPNEEYSSCTVSCTDTYCPTDDEQRIKICDFPSPCDSGCVCKLNYRRLSTCNDTCILAEDCPPVECTRPNEVFFGCRPFCPREHCSFVGQPCSPPFVRTCDPRCTCKDGYYKNDKDVCVPECECSSCPLKCKSTCLNPNPKSCSRSYPNCNCKRGTIWSSDGSKCIPISECPYGPSCNGDRNAHVMEKPPACPSTCDIPNGAPLCKKLGLAVGCVCNNGYILNSKGNCIDPDKCPCGNPCGVNGTFVSCNADCPNDICPVNDSRGVIACDPPYPCPSGCACKHNYQYRSEKDRTCILGQECPPVNCTRPNEEWNICPSLCFDESCSAFNSPPPVCDTFPLPECFPKCTCKPGFARDENDVCIPGEECPTCPLECKSTCLNPNPKSCSSSFYSDCNCKEGTIWSSDGSKCISINECPYGPPCNGDPNAYVMEKPPACPSTCDSPNGSPHCKRLRLDVGCACKNGYILNSEGTCIDPDKCPGGNPCGVNMTFVSCSLSCPDDFCAVNDIRAMIACDPPYPCPSGCVCKYKYQLRSQENRTCILAQECPPVKCTRPNEEWNSCPSPCFDESCSAFNSPPPVCNTLVEPECYPQCTCKPGYARDENDVCIPGEQCPQYCGGSLPQ
ncbi:zonadhesin-like isoform X2 [Ostrinia furnacalis]|uniref:zonadhesin-like isoform X2 n=1 Tax=Ostrinia furnacalis TaxID=93504 RepID=UPI00103BE982|nr:zonadhesin-like isoform X2 [Ostrinia furnacalis]XP_028178886.1 zonadhesin-like isoform X2 [Ostrinia furnacalis]